MEPFFNLAAVKKRSSYMRKIGRTVIAAAAVVAFRTAVFAKAFADPWEHKKTAGGASFMSERNDVSAVFAKKKKKDSLECV